MKHFLINATLSALTEAITASEWFDEVTKPVGNLIPQPDDISFSLNLETGNLCMVLANKYTDSCTYKYDTLEIPEDLINWANAKALSKISSST